jgi:hypothetical protein
MNVRKEHIIRPAVSNKYTSFTFFLFITQP